MSAPDPQAARAAPRPQLGVEALAALVSLWWVLAANRALFAAALQGRLLAAPSTWAFGAALALLLFAVHWLALLLLCNRWTVKPLAALLLLAAASGSWFVQNYGVRLDPAMLRNVLHTDAAEARELLTPALALHLLLYAGLPLALLWKLRISALPWRRALRRRALALAAAALAGAGLLLALFQPLSSLVRNDKSFRYLVTPANVLWSGALALARDGTAPARQPLARDARLAAPAGKRPRLLVLVVGETARAANWGLSGYARQTTPELARWPVLNFARVGSCGTDTETSLPCMFAPVGRRDYDEARIRGQQSLLHLLASAGVQLRWRDNQSGCKGVCDGLPQESVASLNPQGLCDGSRCLDEGLLVGLDASLSHLARARGDETQVWVLHMLGNHGPAYWRRYPDAFARWQPACTDDDLRRCSREAIVNAYDNALLYTDHVLGSLLATLQAHAAQVDSAMLYVSDHGESLGEKSLFLHGMPFVIAPDEQTQVPMTMWWSAGWPAREGLDTACLRRRALLPTSHDALFHTVLGMLDVRTQLYEPAWDLTAGCRRPPAAASARDAS